METYFSKIRNSQEKRNILEIHEKLRKKIIRRPSLLYVLGLEYKKYKKNGITMQPPRMALTTSGGPGNTNNNCVANALENTKGHKEHIYKTILVIFMIPQHSIGHFQLLLAPKSKPVEPLVLKLSKL